MQSDEEAKLFFKTISKKALDYPFINKAALPCKDQTMDLLITTFKFKDIQ